MRGHPTALQNLALLVGSVFLLVGILAFIPGITSHYDDMTLAGGGSGAQLLGIFQVSILLNLVHLLSGVVGVMTARSWTRARTFLVGGGVVFVALWLLGLVNGGDWIPVDAADDWLHFAFGIGMLGFGFVAMRFGGQAPHQNDAATTT